jgi:hypothetical protein
MTEPPVDPVKTLWQTQSKEIEAMQLEDIISKARAFQAEVRRRNLLEYALAALGIAAFVFYVYVFSGWMIKIGSVLCILAVLNIVWRRHSRAAARRVPDAPAAALVDFHRSELIRHRDATSESWLWEVPMWLGAALMLLGRWFQDHAPDTPVAFDHLTIALGAIIVILILVIAELIRRLHVHRLQKQIDALDGLHGTPGHF